MWSTMACGGFDVSIKSDFLMEQYVCILYTYKIRLAVITVCLSKCQKAAGPIGL